MTRGIIRSYWSSYMEFILLFFVSWLMILGCFHITATRNSLDEEFESSCRVLRTCPVCHTNSCLTLTSLIIDIGLLYLGSMFLQFARACITCVHVLWLINGSHRCSVIFFLLTVLNFLSFWFWHVSKLNWWFWVLPLTTC